MSRKLLLVPFTRRPKDYVEEKIEEYKASADFVDGDEIVFPSSRDMTYYEVLASGDYKALVEVTKAVYKADEIVVLDGDTGLDPIMDVVTAIGIRYGVKVTHAYTHNRYVKITFRTM